MATLKFKEASLNFLKKKKTLKLLKKASLNFLNFRTQSTSNFKNRKFQILGGFQLAALSVSAKFKVALSI